MYCSRGIILRFRAPARFYFLLYIGFKFWVSWSKLFWLHRRRNIYDRIIWWGTILPSLETIQWRHLYSVFSINGNTNSHTNQCLKYNLQIYHTKSNFTEPPQIGLHSNVQNCDGCVTAKRSTGQHIGLQPNKHFEELWELNQRTQPPSEKLAPTTLHRTQL